MNEREIRQLIKIVEETGIEEIEVKKWWGMKIRISRRASSAGSGSPPLAVSVPAVEIQQTVPPASTSPVPAEAETVAPAAATEEVAFSEETHYIINSPIVGTFYRAPAPDTPPYVQIGDRIKAGQVVCIVEAMKLMNEIQAERGGTILQILVENAQPVEYNQMLIVLEPEV